MAWRRTSHVPDLHVNTAATQPPVGSTSLAPIRSPQRRPRVVPTTTTIHDNDDNDYYSESDSNSSTCSSDGERIPILVRGTGVRRSSIVTLPIALLPRVDGINDNVNNIQPNSNNHDDSALGLLVAAPSPSIRVSTSTIHHNHHHHGRHRSRHRRRRSSSTTTAITSSNQNQNQQNQQSDAPLWWKRARSFPSPRTLARTPLPITPRAAAAQHHVLAAAAAAATFRTRRRIIGFILAIISAFYLISVWIAIVGVHLIPITTTTTADTNANNMIWKTCNVTTWQSATTCINVIVRGALTWLRTDHFYCYAIIALAPSTYFLGFLNWLGMKFFKHNV